MDGNLSNMFVSSQWTLWIHFNCCSWFSLAKVLKHTTKDPFSWKNIVLEYVVVVNSQVSIFSDRMKQKLIRLSSVLLYPHFVLTNCCMVKMKSIRGWTNNRTITRGCSAVCRPFFSILLLYIFVAVPCRIELVQSWAMPYDRGMWLLALYKVHHCCLCYVCLYICTSEHL